MENNKTLDEIKKRQHREIKNAMKSILRRIKLPTRLYYALEDNINENKYLTEIYYESNPSITRHLVCTMGGEYGERLEINITEERNKHFYNENPKITFYIENFLTKYVDGKCVTEKTIAIDSPERVVSGSIYYDTIEVIHEHTDGKKQKMPYTEEEIKFIKDLKFVNQESRVLKTAIENDCWYTLKYFYPEEDYVRFSVGKDSDVFDYIFVLIAKNGRTAVIEGNNKEASIKYYVNQDRNLEIPSEEFTYYNKTIASKLQIILAELKKQGVDIQETHSITRTRKNNN